MSDPFSARSLGRLAGLLLEGSAVLVAVTLPVSPPSVDRKAVLVVCAMAAALGVAAWLAPWDRWPLRAPLALVPPVFALISAGNYYGGSSRFTYSLFFVIVFAWIGLGQPRGASLWFVPLASTAYLVPILVGRTEEPRAASTVLVTIPVCLLVGESFAWIAERLRRSEAALRTRAQREAMVAAMARRALECEDPAAILEEAVRAAAQALGAERGALFEAGDDGRSLVLRAAAGQAGELAPGQQGPGWPPEPGALCVVVPGPQRPYGVLSFEGGRRPFHAEDVTFAEAVANVLGTALERGRAAQELRHRALHHPLTGLLNRTAFAALLPAALARARRRGTGVAVLVCDLDRLRIVNDGLGYAAGDRLLVAAAGRLATQVRPGDTIGHLGSDEFAVLCEDVGGAQEARRIAERICAAFKEPFVVSRQEVFLTVSIGVAVAGRGEGDLLRQAALATSRVKARGGNGFELYAASMDGGAPFRLTVEAELRRALERGELEVHYQPVIRLSDERVASVEALVRWAHPQRGLMLPGHFIGVAEETGLICEVGEWVIRRACEQAARWESDVPVFVNVSARQLADPRFERVVEQALERAGLPPERLCLEITEGVLMRNPEEATGALRRLAGAGVQVSIDDFGTQYSWLLQLKRIPARVLKVDRSFVAGLGADAVDEAIVRGIVTLGGSLGLTVVAEGVEQPRQLAALRRLGCHAAQGFLLAPPAPAERLPLALKPTSAA